MNDKEFLNAHKRFQVSVYWDSIIKLYELKNKYDLNVFEKNAIETATDVLLEKKREVESSIENSGISLGYVTEKNIV